MLGNPIWILVAALIPLAVGAVWYGPLFGRSWMQVNGFSEDDLKGGNMLMIFGVSILFSILFAFGLSGLTIHQNGLLQLFATHPDFGKAGSEVDLLYKSIMEDFGDRHRTFGHGAVHGIFGSVLFALPLLAINALFERRGWKYIGIHYGYWLVTMVLMCGILCQFM